MMRQRSFVILATLFVLVLVLVSGARVAAEDGPAAVAEPAVEIVVVGASGDEGETIQAAARAGFDPGPGTAAVPDGSPAVGGGTLTVEVAEDGALILTYRDAAGATRARRADAPPTDTERTTMITLLVRSLVDDEAKELLDSLGVAASGSGAAIVVEVTVAQDAQDAQGDQDAQDARDTEEPDLTHVPAAIDFAPYVGFSSFTRGGDVRNFSLGAVGDWSGAIEGLSIGGVLSLAEHHVTGLQLGGVVATAPTHLTGLQISGIFGLAGTLEGGQVGFVNLATEEATGAQIGFVNTALEDLSGTQVGFVNAAAGDMGGFQAGFVNIAGNESAGMQIGFVNYASGDFDGVQIGFVNVADEADVGIGLVNIYPEGRNHVSVDVDTSGFIQGEFSSGSEYFHSLALVGVNPFHGEPAPVFGGGVGGRIPLTEAADLSIDGLMRFAIRHPDQSAYDLLPGLRATFAYELLPGVAVTAAASYTVQVTNDPRTPDYGNLLGWTHHTGATTTRSFVSFAGGVRFF
ncbi:MAG: hypothetical protein DRJ42_05985 [Deltaproteobacteria bacterium]|nr:MAG: hypothetical protein DRJ42_05985 [Deltaproteobacteria bacterium]